MGNRDVAVRFVESFCAGDVHGLSETLSEDFFLKGPLFTFNSRVEYVEALENDPPEPADFDIIEILESNEVVSIFYTYKKPSGGSTIAQLFWFQDERISRTLLVFDREVT